MTAFYGHAWVNVHGQSAQDEEGALTVAGETWQKALVGLEASQFADGLAACIAEGGEFPPSAPRFRSMCLGVPSLAAVRSHFTAGTTQRNTPFVAKCWEFIDSWSYCQSSRAEADRMLREAYEQARDFVMRGGVLPEVPVALIEAQQPAAPQPASLTWLTQRWRKLAACFITLSWPPVRKSSWPNSTSAGIRRMS